MTSRWFLIGLIVSALVGVFLALGLPLTSSPSTSNDVEEDITTAASCEYCTSLVHNSNYNTGMLNCETCLVEYCKTHDCLCDYEGTLNVQAICQTANDGVNACTVNGSGQSNITCRCDPGNPPDVVDNCGCSSCRTANG